MKREKVRPNKRKNGVGGKSSTTHKTSKNHRVYGQKLEEEKNKNRISLPKVKPWKVIVGAIALGIFGVLYISHVFATQQLLREVQQLEREYNQARRLNNSYQLKYDRMTGPAQIYEKAKGMGLINGGPAERIIEVKE
ncbi:MAG TPA: hypothetical protein VFG39_05930 [Balneolaceae bacterium]|nr:hypothetical protein [Balneolaceae bacterium]